MTVNPVVDAATRTLVITGSEGNDVVQVYETVETITYTNGRARSSRSSNSVVTVNDGSAVWTFPRSGINKIVFRGNGGDDQFRATFDVNTSTVDYLHRTSLPIDADGGAGSDSITGGHGNDSILGGLGNDVLVGISGNDRLDGGDGNDELSGGSNNDTLLGGAGNDRLDGGDNEDQLAGDVGDDTLNGDNGHDKLEGADGNDSLSGGAHNDSIYGGTGNDTLDGGEWNDQLFGESGNDLLNGGNHPDIVNGGDGDDTAFGGNGDDQVLGGKGNDSLSGDGGNDWIKGEGGGDTLLGGDGNDRIRGGGDTEEKPIVPGLPQFLDPADRDGNDVIDGGAGNDDISSNFGNDRVNGGLGDDVINGQYGNDALFGDEGNDVIYGSYGTDTLIGDDGNDRLYGGNASGDVPFIANFSFLPSTFYDLADLIEGGDGNDILFGSVGSDTLRSGFGNDELQGQSGNDLLEGQGGDDYIVGGEGSDTAIGGFGNDRLQGDNGDDELEGGDGNDYLHAGDGNDVLRGGQDDDELHGGAGDDSLDAEAGNDSAHGGYGKDTIEGGGGNDRLWGDYDADVIFGGEGNDELSGETGADSIEGGAGNDVIRGDQDNDTLKGGFGDDRIYGGDGNDYLYGAATDGASPSPKDALYGERGDDFLLGAGKIIDTSGNNVSSGDGSATIAKLVSPYELTITAAGGTATTKLRSTTPWVTTTAAFTSTGAIDVVLEDGSTVRTHRNGLVVERGQTTPLGSLVAKPLVNFNLDNIPVLNSLGIGAGLAFGMMTGADIRDDVVEDAPVFDDRVYFVASVSYSPNFSGPRGSSDVSLGVTTTGMTVIVDPIRGMGFLRLEAAGYVGAYGIALHDDLAFRPAAMPEQYTSIVGGNIYSKVDGIEIYKVFAVGGESVIDLPDMSPSEFFSKAESIIDEAFSGGIDLDALEDIGVALSEVRMGVAGNLDLSIGKGFIEAEVRLADATLIFDGENHEIYFRGQGAKNPLEGTIFAEFLGIQNQSFYDGKIDYIDVLDSVIKVQQPNFSAEIDFAEGIEVTARVDSVLLDLDIAGSISWNGDVRFEGHSRAGASFSKYGVDVGATLRTDVVIAGNFLNGQLAVDASLDINIYGILSIDLLFDSLDFGVRGSAHAGLHLTIDQLTDFRATIDASVSVRVYYGPGSFRVGAGAELTFDRNGITVDIDDLPTFRLS